VARSEQKLARTKYLEDLQTTVIKPGKVAIGLTSVFDFQAEYPDATDESRERYETLCAIFSSEDITIPKPIMETIACHAKKSTGGHT